MSYHSFEDLDVWKRSSRLAVEIYHVLRDCREYSIKDQMTRSALSIPSNIAEGAERYSNKEFSRFLYIARGSAAELRTQLYIANKIELIENQLSKRLINEVTRVSAMLHGLIKSLETRNPKPETRNPKPETRNPKP